MKIKSSVLLIFVLILSMGFSQDNSTFNVLSTKLHNSLKYQDIQTAIKTVNEIISIFPEKSLYKDTLLTLYIHSNQNTSAIILATELDEKGKKSNDVLRVMAAYNNSINKLGKSLDYYSKLIQKEYNLFNMYQIAFLQYRLNKTMDCNNTLKKMVSDENASKEKFTISDGVTTPQNVPYSAIAYNMLGMLHKADKTNAKKYLENALVIFPDFELAKKNLNNLK